MIAERFPEIESLPEGDKLILAGELFRAVADTEEREDEIALHPGIAKILQERMDHYLKHPETAISWEELRGRRLPPK